MMKENLRLARPFLILLVIFTAGRWAMSLNGVPYDTGNPRFSLVTLTILSSVYCAAFARRYRGARLGQAAALGATFAICSQLVILVSTYVSYAAGMDSYFNNPIALNLKTAVPLATAMMLRAQGLVANTILNLIAASIGYAMGALLPEK